MKAHVLLALLFCISFAARAGWYHVDNYKGRIGPYPVHLSLQKYESFGSGLDLEGSYYYDKRRAPIPLYGKHTAVGIIEVCEVHSKREYEKYLVVGSKTAFDTSACPFQLTVVNGDLRGTWQAGKTSYEVLLKHTSSLDDTTPHATTDRTEIPFWGQSATHSFIGVYEDSGSGISINRVEVINKANGKVVQTLDPHKHDCVFGFYMTPIYMNIEGWRDDNRIVLNCSGPKDSISAIYRFDAASNRYQFVGIVR